MIFRVQKIIAAVTLCFFIQSPLCYSDNFGPKKRAAQNTANPSSRHAVSPSVQGFLNSAGNFLGAALVVAGAVAASYSAAQSDSGGYYAPQQQHVDRYVQTSKVKYKREYGWSDYYTVDVQYITGADLNRATSTLNYNTFDVYAVIFWGPGEASVIEIDSFLACGSTITQNCINNHIGNLEGTDQQGREWEVCTKNYCY